MKRCNHRFDSFGLFSSSPTDVVWEKKAVSMMRVGEGSAFRQVLVACMAVVDYDG